MRTVVICRGIPGSGKSTRSRGRKSRVEATGLRACIVSADDYFSRTGSYVFDPSKLRDAHAACFSAFLLALLDHDVVIVDNTNIQLWEFENYVKVARIGGCRIEVDELIAKDDAEIVAWHDRGLHNVPLKKMREMHHRWQPTPSDLIEG